MAPSFAALAAVATLFSYTASGHMIMATPAPFGHPENSPLQSSGADFPCKGGPNPNPSFYSGVTNPPVAAGGTQKLSFTGSAVHGGGSCQLALTKDKVPTPSSQWQVILSIEGGCPGISGPATFDVPIPSSIAPGDYIFGWTWISKLAGQPEYYMNCAPLTITGAGGAGGAGGNTTTAGKRSEIEGEEGFVGDDLAIRDGGALPNLFVANLASINSCKTTPSTDPKFPDPGPTVQQPNSAATFSDVQGTNCFPASGGSSGGSTGGGSSGGSGSGGAASSAAGGGASPATSAAGSSPTYAGSGSGSGTYSDSGAGASSAPAVAATSAATAAPSSSLVATPISVPSATSAAAPAASSAAGVSPPSSSGGATTTGGGAGTMSGPCSNEGAWNCIGGTAFQRCASGQWSTTIPMAAGETCQAGQSMDLAIAKRSETYYAPRFPGLRRHREILRGMGRA